MTRRPVIFDIDDDQPPEMQALLRSLKPEGFDLVLNDGGAEAMREALARADYILVERYRVTEEIIQAAPHLKMIQKCGRGVEIIDVPAVQRRGITLACTSSANSAGTAELAVALMLSACRRICEVHHALTEGRWLKFEMRFASHELTGKTVGIVGAGNVGRRVARTVSHGFGCKVLYHSRSRLDPEEEREHGMTYCSLEELLRESDFVSLHLALTPGTHHFMNAEKLAAMKRSAILINTSRGAVVDEEALAAALRDGVISMAGLDVYEKEPPAADNPLLKSPNVVLSAHCGGGTVETVSRVFGRALGNIARVERGEAVPEEDLVTG